MTSSRSTRLARRAVRVAVPLIALATVLLPACAPGGRACSVRQVTIPRAAFDELGVCQVVSAAGAGSALPLGGGRFLTCRHVLPTSGNTVQMKNPRDDLGLFWRTVDGRDVLRLVDSLGFVQSEADGERVLQLRDAPDRALTILASGGTDWDPHDSSTVSADWAIFEVSPCDDLARDCRSPAVDFERKLVPGEDIFMVGYLWSHPVRLPGPLVLPTYILHGRVRSLPPLCRFKPGPDVICVEIVDGPEVGTGMSGGPALVWDEDAQQLVVVGLCQGAYPYTFIGLPIEMVPTVIRPPAQAAARQKGDKFIFGVPAP